MDRTAPDEEMIFQRLAWGRAKERWRSDEGATNFSFEIPFDRVKSDQ
jgi:hypothetical protein